jgi:hypothetical protein
VVDIGFFHPVEELAGIGAEALHISALALGIEGLHDQAGFSGAREAGDDDQFILWDIDTDILKVIAPGAHDLDLTGDGGQGSGR